MGFSDALTGGGNENAKIALKRAQDSIDSVRTPTESQLSLPELQQYVNAGVMTPAQMQAYLQENNAYNTENIDQTGTRAQIAALNQLAGVANAGAEGTPVEQAQVQNVINQMSQSVGGQRGAIEQEAAARGTPMGLIQSALENQTVGQDATIANQNALQAQAQAYQQAVNAMSQGANVGANLQGQQNTQANTVAQAQNAMQQFNAANQQNAASANAGYKQQSNAYNTENTQNVANANTGNANYRTEYNAKVPQSVFEDQMQKATGQAGVAQNQANQATQAGQQEAGLWGGIIGAGATLAGGPMAGMAAKTAFDASQGPRTGAQNAAHGAIIGSHDGCYHDGGICMDGGGMVPGRAEVPGDSLKNDKVHAMVSPGEAVIPRTAVQEHMPEVLRLIAAGHDQAPPPPHPQDIATLLQAMRHLRGAA